MSESASTEKLSATVPRGLAAQIRERAGRGNVSAYVTEALLRQLDTIASVIWSLSWSSARSGH